MSVKKGTLFKLNYYEITGGDYTIDRRQITWSRKSLKVHQQTKTSLIDSHDRYVSSFEMVDFSQGLVFNKQLVSRFNINCRRL